VQDLIAARFEEGLAHHRQDRFAEAQAAYGEVLTADPGHADAWRLMSLLAERFGRPDLAQDWAGKARALEPSEVHHLFGEGVALQQIGRLAEAEARYRQVVALAPDALEANNNLGLILTRLNRDAEALAFFRRAVELSPGSPVFHYNLGVALTNLDRHAEAETSFRAATIVDPQHVGARHNLGKSLRAQGRLDEAGHALQEALRLKQDDPRILNDMGVLLGDLGRVADAEMVYRTGLSLESEDADLHHNLGLLLLKTGQHREGWPEFHWRWKTDDPPHRRIVAKPEWDGSPLPGGRLLISAEQGLGDILQFCRLAPLAAARLGPDAKVTLEVYGPLASLLRGQWPDVEVITQDAPLPAVDAQIPLISLAGVLDQTHQTIDGAPYLRPDPERAAAWAERLAPLKGLKVGLVWAGGQFIGAATDRRRSVTLAALAPLAAVPGVSFVSLQKDAPAAQAKSPPDGLALLDLNDDLTSFVETAAVVANLDLVISVDTAVAHLAGAIGTPVWLLNRFDTCWRWELEREDTPWYTGLRQFRQPAYGDWASVVAAVATALAERAGE
jgi:Flp pilus assembly protein TadD